MPMAVMCVGDVGMIVDQHGVRVHVRVRLVARRVGRMLVLVVQIVDVRMLVGHGVVDVPVAVPLAHEA
jgi:hypothetical protein